MSGRYAKNLGTDWRTRSVGVSLAAEGLNTRAESYCADVQSDGFVTEVFIGAMCGGKPDKRVIAELVKVGWWKAHTKDEQTGYLLTSYTARNGTRAEAEERARKNAARQQRHRDRDGGDDNDGGNGPGNGPRNALLTRPPVSSPSHQSPERASHAERARGPTPAGIVESEFVTALGAAPKPGAYRPRSGDHEHFGDAATAMEGAGILRETARSWCTDFVVEFTHRTPKNLALYAQTRAANGGAKVVSLGRGKRDGWQAPAESEAFAATEITSDLFKREASS